MPHTTIRNGRAPAIALLLVPFACVGVMACGSSSSESTSSSPTTTAAAARTTAGTTGTGATASGVATTGTTTTSSPTAESASSSEAARAARHASYRRIAVSYVHCMHRKGINLPQPNAENEINPKGIDTNSQRYKTANSRCVKLVLAAASRKANSSAK